MWEKQNHKCKWCGVEITEEEAQADHIIPWSKGGKTIVDNLQILCRKCNGAKSDN